MNPGTRFERLYKGAAAMIGAGLDTLRRGARYAVPGLTILVLVMTSGCRYPKDIEHSLERIQGGVMRAGVSENPPWVIRTASGPAGLEPEMIKTLARQLDAEVQWHWGTESELMLALAERQLDIAAGGLIKQSSLSKDATFSQPYFQTDFSVGFPARSPHIPQTLQDIKVQLSPVSPIGGKLRSQDAIPILTEVYDDAMPIAAPIWWLKAHGFQPGPWVLATDKHVIALPPGENAWILVVQRHLDSYRNIDQLLQQLEAGNEN